MLGVEVGASREVELHSMLEQIRSTDKDEGDDEKAW
jgi:hypothetical protein